ncbi:MAG: hypothetical protein ACK5IP_14735 [Paracoccus sp. (in: a-proteobacteria)]
MIRKAAPFAATVAALVAALAGPADAAVVHFCWQGENGYTMTGRMEFPDALLTRGMITEADVTAFRITGYRDGEALGSWDMAGRRPDATWYLRYMPIVMQFPVDEKVPGPFDQGWNADGTARDCGNPGFGFNAGNYAQDFCVNGVWVEESGMPPPTPFYAMTTPPPTPDCSGPMLMSKAARRSE